jgi:hypothetical protein
MFCRFFCVEQLFVFVLVSRYRAIKEITNTSTRNKWADITRLILKALGPLGVYFNEHRIFSTDIFN